MDANELKTRFPQASPDFIRANATEPGRAALQPGSAGAPTVLERDPRARTVGKVQIQGKVGSRFLAVVTSYRRRLLDEDNLCCKYVIDLCRYSGVLPSDAPGITKIEVRQEKVGSKEQEFVRVEIFKT